MFYRNILFIILFVFFSNCSSKTLTKNKLDIIQINNYSNTGFALVYNDELYNQKIVSKKIDERSLVIFQRNLKYNTKVKITNMINNKSTIGRVGRKSKYPLFNNSVLSKRIAEEINLNIKQPYIEIVEISGDSVFVAKKLKLLMKKKM